MALEVIHRYNFLPMRRGDTFLARTMAQFEQPLGTPKGVASARMEVRTKAGVVIHTWDTAVGSITISGAGSHIVALGAVAEAVTELWTGGDHVYDFEVVWAAGGKRTVMAGQFPIVIDTTLPPA